MRKSPQQLPIEWDSPSPMEDKQGTVSQQEQAFQWDHLTSKRSMGLHGKLKILWNLADQYRTAGRMKDSYKAERWARGMGQVLLSQETSLWGQYIKAREEGDERLLDFLSDLYDEVITVMESFDAMLDLDFEERAIAC